MRSGRRPNTEMLGLSTASVFHGDWSLECGDLGQEDEQGGLSPHAPAEVEIEGTNLGIG